MSETAFDLGATEAPDNKEKVYLKPGYRKLSIVKFVYEKEDDGKTPLIVMNCTTKDGDETVEFNENFYLSGKLNKKGIMSSVARLQELTKGLTGDKMNVKLDAYTYTKKEQNGSSESYVIPNPQQICDYLNKKCTGKTGVFRIGGDKGDDGRVYSSLTYSGFLYWTDKKGDLCRYIEERDFTESEYKYNVKNKKAEFAPTTASGIVDTKALDDF